MNEQETKQYNELISHMADWLALRAEHLIIDMGDDGATELARLGFDYDPELRYYNFYDNFQWYIDDHLIRLYCYLFGAKSAQTEDLSDLDMAQKIHDHLDQYDNLWQIWDIFADFDATLD